MMKSASLSLGIFLALLLGACAAGGSGGASQGLSREAALDLAVILANTRCMDDFQHAPFDTASYALRLEGARWHWGRLDPPGVRGFCAEVSFDLRGGHREVDVCFTHDALPPVENPRAPGP